MDKFIIIDGNNLMFRAFYALPQLSNFDGEISNAVFGFCNMLIKLIKEINPKYIAVTFDKGKQNFRLEKYPEYKGTRGPTPDELKPQFAIVKEVLRRMNITVVEKEGLEADDLMGCLSRRFNTDNYIVSADRDTFQLITNNTQVIFPKKGVSETILLDRTNLKEYYGVDPEQVVDLKALMGDQSDNIPGVAGVGDKTAKSLLEKYINLDGVYDNIENITGKLKDKLINDKDKAYLSKFLATIVTYEDLPYVLEDFTFDFPFSYDVYEIFKKYQFNILIKKEELYVTTKKINYIDQEVVVIDNIDTLNDLKSRLLKCKEFAMFINNDNINLYLDKEYKVNCVVDLLSTGINFDCFLNTMKDIFENDKIGKIVFDAKSTKHYLYNFGIKLNGVVFDILIARYLINSIAKINVNISDVMSECGINSECYAYALKTIKDIYYAKMEELALLDVFNNIEMPLIDVLFDMENQGFKIDKKELDELQDKYSAEIAEIENLIYECAGCKFNINSPKQLGEILFDKLDLNIPSNKKKSTSADILTEIQHKHPIVPLIIRHRLITKLFNTYIIGFENIVDKDNKIHTIFNQTMTSTGRLSSSEPNLQNIPVRNEEGRSLRKIFIPSNAQGFIVSADYSQIELRLLAHFSGDEKLINSYNEGKDIHASTASEIFDIPIDSVTDELRRQAKSINFGIIYGISDFGLSQNIGISRKEASDYIKKYLERYPNIGKFMDNNIQFCKDFGFVRTISGRIRPIPEIKSNNYNLRLFGERAAMNMPLQGTASDIIKLAMIRSFREFNRLKLKSKIILQVHDELVVDCYPGELDVVKKILRDNMENVYDLKVKLTVNIESGKTWFDAK